MKNVSIKKRARKNNNNNNKKYNKTQTKRSRRNKTQRNNRRRRNFRNKTHRGGVSHRPSPLRKGEKAYGVPIGSAARIAQGYGAAKSIAPTNSKAEIAAELLRQQSYDPRDINVDEVEGEISDEIQLMTDEIGKEFLKIEKLEEENTKLQESYISASAEERSIMSGSIGDQVRQNYGEIAGKKSDIDKLKRLIKGNEDAMKKLAKNIAIIINTSKIHKKEDEENTPHGIIMRQMIERGPGEKESWRFFLINNLPGLARYFYKPPGSITS